MPASPPPSGSGPAGTRAGAVLVLGGSGLIGVPLLRLLRRQGIVAAAVTRAPQPPAGLVGLAQWRSGPQYDLYAPAAGASWPRSTTVFSAGPLDALAAWLERGMAPQLRHLVAIGSTSVATKQASPDPAERQLARTLQRAEQRLVAHCREHGIAWTILRPTLVWGEGRDRNVSRIAALARRRRWLPLPGFATGLRQPVRHTDVARAMLLAWRRPAAAGHCLDLPGGETLPYLEMVRRVAAAASPRCRLLVVPARPACLALAAARGVRLLAPGPAALAARMAQDLVFDGRPAQQLLGLVPEGFQPRAGDFPPPPA